MGNYQVHFNDLQAKEYQLGGRELYSKLTDISLLLRTFIMLFCVRGFTGTEVTGYLAQIWEITL